MVSSMSISIARGSWVMMSGPFHFRGHRRQDRLDIAAGFQFEGGTAVVEQVDLDIAAAAQQLLVAMIGGPRHRKTPAHQFGKEFLESAADLLAELKVRHTLPAIMM